MTPLMGIAFAFCAGILIEGILDVPLFYIFFSSLVFLLLSILSIRSRKRFLLFAGIAFLLLGSLAYKNSIIFPPNHIKNLVGKNYVIPQRAVIGGEVLNKPEKSDTHYHQKKVEFLLQVNTINLGGGWSKARGVALVQALNPSAGIRYADDIIIEGEISPPRPATNPGQFDYKRFLERRGIFYVLRAGEGSFLKVEGRSPTNPLKVIAYSFRERMRDVIDRFIPKDEAALLKAMLIGERRDISQDINDDFMKTGTVHILSISGLHIALIASMLFLLLRLFRIPFGVSSLILAFMLVIYCIMVDARPPVTRSTIMILVFLLGRLLRRRQNLLNTLAFSALAILFINPQDLFDIGFQLSFLTVGSIAYLTPKLEGLFLKNYDLKFTNYGLRIKIYLIRAAIVSFSAWLGSAPFIARYFNILSPITVIANLIIVPWVSLVLALSMTFVFFGALSYTLGLIFSQTAFICAKILIKMASALASIPFSYVRIPSPSWISIIGFYAFLFLFFNRAYLKVKAKYFLITALIFFNILIWQKALFIRPDSLNISFLDVGKGDAIFLEFPKGGTMLIDGGEGLGVNMGSLIVGRFLSSKGINGIDIVVSTHPHTDHIGGLVAVLKNFRVRYFIDNADAEENPFYYECHDLIKQKRIQRFIVREGDSIKGLDDVEIDILNPPEKKFSDLNNNSVVIKLKYGGSSVLFCGDIKEEAAKNLLLNKSERLPSRVLKAPHHGGSMGETGQEFIGKINPEIAVVSLGSSQKVDGSILLELNRLKTGVYRTDKNGAIFVKIYAKKCLVSWFKNN